ncbi:MAG: hypothetical protein VKL59_19490 [Nostocaceae cyanobacterium]|nr:hypothetical protein [Nostocaceae cyanobacterium]
MMKIQPKQTAHPIIRWLSLAVILNLVTGCSPPQWLFPNPWAKDNISIKVEPSDRPGVYNLTGTANMPDNTKIAIAAIRYLQPREQQLLSLHSNLTYSMLAYQEALVKNGKWQTNLNLWEVASDGSFREVWQIVEEPKLKISLEPVKEISFIATTTRAGQAIKMQKQVDGQIQRLANKFLKYTTDGEQYAHISKIMPVDLPTGKTDAPAVKPEDFNFGWGDRYIIKEEDPNINRLQVPPEERQRTTAPISPSDFLR